jgi:hypothetical protein
MAFPTSLDTITATPAATATLATGSHTSIHTALKTLLEAVQAKLGINGSAVTTSHDYKLSGVTGTDKAVSKTGTETLTNKTFTSPVINTPTGDVATKTGTETFTNKTFTSPIENTPTITAPIIRNWDGWEDAAETWSYASATTITVPSGAATKYTAGDKIKLTQTTVKYFIISSVADTVLTIVTSTDYTLANAVISNNYYSHSATPIGFPREFNYTPTFSGAITTGNATVLGRYSISGGICVVTIRFLAGNTTSFGAGALTMSLPAGVSISTPSADIPWTGTAYIEDAATQGYFGGVQLGSTTTLNLMVSGSASNYATSGQASSTVPMTWTTNDFFNVIATFLI